LTIIDERHGGRRASDVLAAFVALFAPGLAFWRMIVIVLCVVTSLVVVTLVITGDLGLEAILIGVFIPILISVALVVFQAPQKDVR
jgi:hypothetical protein